MLYINSFTNSDLKKLNGTCVCINLKFRKTLSSNIDTTLSSIDTEDRAYI